MFINYLKETFKENTPILLEEISYEDRPQYWILQMLDNLCKDGQIARFYGEEIWYIPTITFTGKKSILNPEIVISRKYIRNDTNIYGFYGGIAMQNLLGLTTQNVVTPLIYTNKWTSPEETKVSVGWCDVVLEKPRTTVTPENVYAITLLELVEQVPEWWFKDKDRDKLQRLALYIKEKQITKHSLYQYLPLFSENTLKQLEESELIAYATQ